MTRVWDESDARGADLLALLALADWSNDEGECWPSYDKLAKKMRVTRSAAIRTVKRLEERGDVTLTKRPDPERGNKSNVVCLARYAAPSSVHATTPSRADAPTPSRADATHIRQVETSREDTTAPPPVGGSSPKREDQRIFDCLCAVFGQSPAAITTKTRGRFNRAIKGWMADGITADLLAAAVDRYDSETGDTAHTYLSEKRLDEWIGKVRASKPQPIPADFARYLTSDGRAKQPTALMHLPGFENIDLADPATWPAEYRAALVFAKARHGN